MECLYFRLSPACLACLPACPPLHKHPPYRGLLLRAAPPGGCCCCRSGGDLGVNTTVAKYGRRHVSGESVTWETPPGGRVWREERWWGASSNWNRPLRCA